MDSSGDEAGKKRDNAQVEQKDQKEENPKKVRVEASSSRNVTTNKSISPARRRIVRDSSTTASSASRNNTNNDSSPGRLTSAMAETTINNNNNNNNSSMSTNNNEILSSSSSSRYASSSTGIVAKSSTQQRRIWDLEGALHYLVQAENCKEYLTDDKSKWVTFRVGHAGDASTIASLYRQSCRQNRMRANSDNNPELEKDSTTTTNLESNNSNDEESSTSSSSMLEVWLADGLGDEDTPPSVYCLLANVHKKTASSDEESSSAATPSTTTTTRSVSSLGAVVILTLAWDDGERVLRIEWMHIDDALTMDVASMLARRLWFRLSTLSLMTACQVLSVDEQYTKEAMIRDDDHDGKEAKRVEPSAE